MNRLTHFVMLMIFLLSMGCTQLHIRNQGQIPLSLTPQVDFVERVEIKGRFEYYLWGNYPAEGRTLFIDKVLQEQGVYSAANVTVTRERDFQDLLASFLSFGMYTPLSYTIYAYKKETQR